MRSFCIIILILVAVGAGAQEARPALKQLGREMQSLYRQCKQATVTVRVPIRAVTLPATSQPVDTLASPTTQPLVEQWVWRELLAVVIDHQGHVVLPMYLDKSLLGDTPLSVKVDTAHQTTATIVGTDLPSNLSVLRLHDSTPAPAALSDSAPLEGEMVILLAPDGSGMAMMLWTGGRREMGCVVDLDGSVRGFVRFGQYLPAPAMARVAGHLIQHGKVRRALLGVVLSEVRAVEPGVVVTDRPATDRPATDKPQTDRPLTDNPPTDRPLTGKHPADSPATNPSQTDKPSTENPGTTDTGGTMTAGLAKGEPRATALPDNRPTLRVRQVLPNTVAERAGLRVGDTIIAIEGESVQDLPGFAAALAGHEGLTTLQIVRDGKTIAVEVDLKID